MSVVLRTTILVLLMLCAEHVNCPAADGTVVVKPDTLVQTGWVVASQRGSQSKGEYEFTSGYGLPPAGKGSFCMWVGYGDSDPLPKIYLGTNNFNGVRLDKITQFKLWICPRWNDYGDAQPVTVELAISQDNQVRLFTYLPWGFGPSGFYNRFVWREINMMRKDGVWELTNSSSEDRRGNWQWLVGRYPGASITTPSVRDWPDGTITGTGVNVKIGAGKATDAIREAEARSWWKESCGCRAYIDKLTIGYVGNQGDEIVKAYDFEAD